VRAHAWHALGNWEKAYADVVALLEVRPTTASYRDAADLAIALGKLDEADTHLAAALAQAPGDLELTILACRLHIAHTEAPDAGPAEAGAALRECERAVKLAPQHGPTRRRLGRMLAEQGELDGALAHADEAARLMPGSCLAHRLRAEVLLKLKKPTEALAAAEAALVALPEDSEVNARLAEGVLRQSLADVLIALKRQDEARSELEKALTLLDPDDEDAATAVKQKLNALSGPKR
jgi:tetratricopeptide (TPR) repeat protein